MGRQMNVSALSDQDLIRLQLTSSYKIVCFQ